MLLPAASEYPKRLCYGLAFPIVAEAREKSNSIHGRPSVFGKLSYGTSQKKPPLRAAITKPAEADSGMFGSGSPLPGGPPAKKREERKVLSCRPVAFLTIQRIPDPKGEVFAKLKTPDEVFVNPLPLCRHKPAALLKPEIHLSRTEIQINRKRPFTRTATPSWRAAGSSPPGYTGRSFPQTSPAT